MNITGSPTLTSFPINKPLPDSASQRAPASTASTPSVDNPVDDLSPHSSSNANTTGDQVGEGSVREKRGFKFPGFGGKGFGRQPKLDKLPSNGTPGVFKPKPKAPVSPGSSGGSPNTSGITNFRNIVFKAQHPGSSISGPAKPVIDKPATFGDVATNLIAADRLVKAGVFKTDTSLKTVTRDAFVNASVNGLVSTPLSIGTYAGSVWSGETIKGNFSANTPLLPAAHQPAPSQQNNGVAPAAGVAGTQEGVATDVLLENAELKFLFAANTIQTLVEGGDANALGKSSNWPTDTKARFDNLEALYDAAEKSLGAVATENDFIFKPYKADSASDTRNDAARLDTLEKRYEALNKGIGRMIAVRSLETQEKEQEV